MLKHLLILCAFTAVSMLGATDIKVNDNGTIQAAGLLLKMTCASKKWAIRDYRKFKNIRTERSQNRITFSAESFLADSNISAEQCVIFQDGKNSCVINGQLKFSPALDMASSVYNTTITEGDGEIIIDGKTLTFPKNKNIIIYRGKAKEISIRKSGTEELLIYPEENTVFVESHLRSNKKELDLNLVFPESSGNCSGCKISFKIKTAKLESTPVDMTTLVNRPLADTPQRPGWTLQGPGHDMSKFPGESKEYAGIKFTPVPGMALTVGGQRRIGTVREKVCKLPENNAKALHLIQTSAWTSGDYGKLTIRFKNGKTQQIVLNGMRDGGDWTEDRSKPNGIAVWSRDGQNGKKQTVFFCSFALQYDSPVEIKFTALTPNIYWAVCGISLGSRQRLIKQSIPYLRIAKHGKEWNNLEFHNNTVKGSALDFSYMLDAPAGKHGRAMPAPDGTLRFADGKRLRLFGVNLTRTMTTLEKKEYIDALAEQLSRAGYNAVRIHFFVGEIYKGKTTCVDPVQLDKVDYLFYALKKRGIYYTTDIWAGNNHELPKDLSPLVAFSVDKEMRQKWFDDAKYFFTRKNPYTGISLAEDPALVFANLMNEDNLTVHWNNSKACRELVLKHFKTWVAKNRITPDKVSPENPHFTRFLIESQMEAHADMIRFIRKELKCDLPLTSLNFYNEGFLIPMREQFDVVDTHNYISHPIFTGKPWYSPRFYLIEKSIWDMAQLSRRMFLRRMYGKPFMVSEYNICKPNPYRSECAMQIGAYAALQDWDGLFRFCYSHSRRRIQKCMPAIDDFEVVADPVKQLGDRLTSMLFLREDVQAAKKRYVYTYSRDTVKDGGSFYTPAEINYLGLISQVGSTVKENPIPSNCIEVDGKDFSRAGKDSAAWQKAAKNQKVVSETGEIVLDPAKKLFSVITPKTEAFVLEKGAVSGKTLKVSNASEFQLVSLLSLDNAPLKNSRRMLFMHLTDITNTNSKVEFEGSKARTLFLGELPLLVKNAKVQVSLENNGRKFDIYALSADGKRLNQVKTSVKNGKTLFSANTAMHKSGVMAYEIITSEGK